jgi:hypothetical protein
MYHCRWVSQSGTLACDYDSQNVYYLTTLLVSRLYSIDVKMANECEVRGMRIGRELN